MLVGTAYDQRITYLLANQQPDEDLLVQLFLSMRKMNLKIWMYMYMRLLCV